MMGSNQRRKTVSGKLTGGKRIRKNPPYQKGGRSATNFARCRGICKSSNIDDGWGTPRKEKGF